MLGPALVHAVGSPDRAGAHGDELSFRGYTIQAGREAILGDVGTDIGRQSRRAFRGSARRGSSDFVKFQVSVAPEVRCRARQCLVADGAFQNRDARKSARGIRPNPRRPDTTIVADCSY